MSEYGIITGQGNVYTKPLDLLTTTDCLIVEGDYSGTMADPVQIISYGSGGVGTWGGGLRYFNVTNYSGVFVERQNAGSGWKYFVFSYFKGDDPLSPSYFNVVVAAAANVQDALDNVQNERTYVYALYKGSLAEAQMTGAISDLEEPWDESPSDSQDNPDGTNPMGGEFADRDPLGYGNDDIDLPETVLEMDYSGLISAYQLDNGELFALGDAIFTSNTWTIIQNKFNGIGDPISYIISAVEIPFDARSPEQNFNLGGINVVNNSGNYVPIHTIANRYHKFAFRPLTLKETWGTEKDYTTTDVAIYLPYAGVKDLDTSILMNSTITVKGVIDVWTGDILYVIVVDNKAAAYKYLGSHGIIYRFQGNCGKSIPIGKSDNTAQLLAMAGSIASMGVGLAAGMPTGAMGYTVGNEFGASADVSGGVNPRLVGGGAAGLLGALSMGPKVSMAGGVSGAIGRGDVQQPYLIIKQSVPVYPKNWRSHFGAPRYQEYKLSDLSGFVKCADVHAEAITGANDAERAAIEQALKAGVFV